MKRFVLTCCACLMLGVLPGCLRSLLKNLDRRQKAFESNRQNNGGKI